MALTFAVNILLLFDAEAVVPGPIKGFTGADTTASYSQYHVLSRIPL